MKFILPLEEMTTTEKLAAMEQLWDDLTRNPESMFSPAWHEDVLTVREEKARKGAARFMDLPSAKDRIRKSTK